MSLEEQIGELIKAIKENTASNQAVLAAKGGAAPSKTAPAKADKKPAKPKHTVEELKAAVTALAKAKGKPKAAEIIAEFVEEGGLAALIADPSKHDEAYDRIVAVTEEAEEDDTDGL